MDTMLPTADFSWQLQGRIMAVDNGARLPAQANFTELMASDALAVVAFDPASRLREEKHLQGMDELQIVPNALLGDGEQATLHACMDPAMSATLEPLPAHQLPAGKRDGAQVLARLPMATLTLDSITGLNHVDWLLLDERHDSLAALEHGQQYLKDTLLVHARIPFMPTHQRQPDMGSIYSWMIRHGFQCYQFSSSDNHSHLPEDTELLRKQATQLSTAEAVFVPDEQRLAVMPASRLTRLAFLMDTVHNVHDFTYSLLARFDSDRAESYLASRGYISQYEAEADTFTLTAEYAPAPWPMPKPVLPSAGVYA